MSEKLKRATVPMCPECGGECEQQGEAVFDCRCGKSWSFPDCGYNAPEVAPDIPRSTPPDEVGEIAREMRETHCEFSTVQRPDRTNYGTLLHAIETWAARLSRYTPVETEEVRLLRELRRYMIHECYTDTVPLRVRKVLDALAELEGRDE